MSYDYMITTLHKHPLYINEKVREVPLSEVRGLYKMGKLLFVLCLFGELRASPFTHDNKVVIPKEVFDDSFIKYTAEHDIVDIVVPLNNINFDTSSDSDTDSDDATLTDVTVFFVEADLKDGKRVDHGLYVYKNNNVKKILATGRTASASSNDNKLVYFGASDGLYVYDVDSDSAVKYGPITDSILSIATDDEGKYIYILTEDHKLYKVTIYGQNKETIDDVVDAQEIIVDDSNNLYYYTSNNDVYIRTEDGVHKVESLPKSKSIKLIRPPFILFDAIALLHDNSVAVVFANGTSEELDIEFSPEAKPTALGPEAVFAQYYAHNKKLYEYNIIALMSNAIFESLKEETEALHHSADQIKHKLGTKKV